VHSAHKLGRHRYNEAGYRQHEGTENGKFRTFFCLQLTQASREILTDARRGTLFPTSDMLDCGWYRRVANIVILLD
jgi:hypothetical protein